MSADREFSALDLLSVWSLALGYENLQENRQQSRHNDISAANDKQAQYLLSELEAKFAELADQMAKLNDHLTEQDRKLSKLLEVEK